MSDPHTPVPSSALALFPAPPGRLGLACTNDGRHQFTDGRKLRSGCRASIHPPTPSPRAYHAVDGLRVQRDRVVGFLGRLKPRGKRLALGFQFIIRRDRARRWPCP